VIAFAVSLGLNDIREGLKIKASDIKKVLIIGSGTMGRQIGMQHAIFGYDVVLYDVDAEVLKVAVSHIGKMAARFCQEGYISEKMLQNVQSRITVSSDPQQASQGIQLVSESIPENLALKRKVWGEFGKLLPPDAILTTNTSSLLPSEYAEATGSPERFLAWHFHLPAFKANIVDVMPLVGTDPAVSDIMMEHSVNIGQIPIRLKKESSRYVYNEMLGAWLKAAVRLVVNGVASVEDIDRCWMVISGVPAGPFGIMDSIGINTNYHVASEELAASPDVQTQAIVDFYKAKVDAGELGRKTGKGFYTYPNPAYEQPEFVARVERKYKK
jgi:3-hydroxybutyryl-CoA dehydrogenase